MVIPSPFSSSLSHYLVLPGSYIIIDALHQIDDVRHGRTIAVGVVNAVALVVGGPEVRDAAASSGYRGITLIPYTAVNEVWHRGGITEDILWVTSVLNNAHLFFELTAHEHYRQVRADQLLHGPVVDFALGYPVSYTHLTLPTILLV